MKILLSAYTCGAGCGSEPGVGWNVARGLALRGHQITVVTSPLYQEQTQRAIDEEKLDIRLIQVDNNTKSNLFIKRHVRWQKKAALVIREEALQNHYDVVHHVTFNQYRGLRDVFQAGIPYVVGPVGGAECIPLSLLWHGKLRFIAKVKELLRYVAADAIPAIVRCNFCHNKGLVFASNTSTAKRLNSGIFRLKEKARVLPAIAISKDEISRELPPSETREPYMLFYGSFSRPEKGIGLVLEAFSAYRRQGGKLKLVIVGMKEKELNRTSDHTKRLGIPDACIDWRGFVPRVTMLDLMRRATAVLYTAYRDSGSMSVLEGVALGVNVLCFDIDSQAWLPDELAIKIPVPSLFAGKGALVKTLEQGMAHAEKLPPRSEAWHLARVAHLNETMTWEKRMQELEHTYNTLVPYGVEKLRKRSENS